MKKILAILLSMLIGVCSMTFAVSPTSAEENTAIVYTLEDVRLLQDFLLRRPTEDLSEKDYDLDHDGVWTVFDLCLMKWEVIQFADDSTDMLVVYFSRTGNTEKIAGYLTDITGADVYEIEAAIPYTDEDIAYGNASCRANKEQNDKSARPEIAQPLESIDDYDVIYLGYPIWWGEEPRIIDTFLESYDFSEKTVIPFCTSASSGIGTSEKNIAALVSIGNQLEGKRFAASSTSDAVQEWVDSLSVSVNTEE